MRAYRRTAFKAALLSTCLLTPATTWAQTTGPVTTVDEIVVTGRRAADRAAIESKRQSDNQVDAIRADDVGRLPDQNVAEAVRRLPGVSVSNDQGEGRYLTVRGVSPDLLNVTLNGQTAAAPEPDGRQVKLDDIPSALIGSVTLVKTLTPDLDANAIAGQANIQTLTAFDRNRTFATARAAYGYYDQNGKKPYEFDGTVGGLFGENRQFGAVVALNYSDREIGSQQFAGSPSWLTINGRAVPDSFAIRHYSPHRKRSGAVGNFDWRPNDTTSLFLRLLYSQYKDEESRQHFGFAMPTSAAVYSSQTDESGSFSGGGRADRRSRLRREDTSTTSYSAGGKFEIGESTLNVEATYSRADKKDPRRDEWTFRTGSNVGGTYANTGSSLFTITPGAAAYDPTKFAAYQVRFGRREAVEDLYQARVDYQTPFGGDGDSWLKFGAKIIDRKKDNDEDRETWRINSSGTLTLAGALGPELGAVFSGDYFGPSVDHAAADAYFRANPTHFGLRTADTLADSLGTDYQITERISAAYAMANLKFGSWTVVPGLRVENTDGDFAAKTITVNSTLGQDFDSFGSRNYTKWFPGVNLRYDATENLVLRGAITTAIGRPNYEDIAPYVKIEDVGGGWSEVAMGNPNLDPLMSVNYDLAIEYYVGDRGILSAAAFYKDIDNPIFSSRQTVTGGTFGGLVLPNAFVTKPINADSAKVSGLEFNAQYELSFLPSPFDGFSVGGNLTFVNSEAEGVPGRPDKVPLMTQSDRVGSAQVTYEKNGFSGRVGYTYRSGSLLAVGASANDDNYVDDFNQWDARVSYAFNKHATVFVEGSNLNDAPARSYIGQPSHLLEEERYGWSVRTGLQLSF